MKDWLKHGIFLRTLGRIWGAAGLAFLASLLPMYILRGFYHGDAGTARLAEDLLMTGIGIVFGFLFLLLLQSRRKDTLQRSKTEICLDAAGGVGIYFVMWVLLQLWTKNTYLVAFCGYHLGYLLGVDGKKQPVFWAALVAALVYCCIYFAALLLGCKLANYRARKIYERLQKTEESI